MKKNILVVDDEKEIAELIELYLKNDDMNVFKYYTGNEAIKCIEKEKIDLAILDVMLPDIDGFSVCRKIREKYNYPIIMLSAKGEDAYLTKPFRPLELIANVKAQLRRATKYNNLEEKEEDKSLIVFSGIVLNKANRTCTLNEKPLNLTPTEFSILWLLCENRGQVISAERLFEQVWGEKYFTNSTNTIMVHIRHLREKMNDSAEHPKYIKTVWGVGYKIE